MCLVCTDSQTSNNINKVISNKIDLKIISQLLSIPLERLSGKSPLYEDDKQKIEILDMLIEN